MKNNNKFRGLITLQIGLLALVILNCNGAVNNSGSQSVSQSTTNNQITNNQTVSALEIPTLTQDIISRGQSQSLGVLQLTVSEVEAEDLNVLNGHFVISSIEARTHQSHDENADENDDDNGSWTIISNYEAAGKSYDIVPGDASTYQIDRFLLPAGDFRQLRINFIDGQSQVLVLENSVSTLHDVRIPSGDHSGLKLRGLFSVQSNMETVLAFRLELEKTGHHNGHNGHNDHGNRDHQEATRSNGNGHSDNHSGNSSDYLIRPKIRFVSATVTSLPVVLAPAFTPAAGTYNVDQNVSIESGTAQSTICYSVDGTIPACDVLAACTAGLTYASPVLVSVSETVNALACKAGYTASSVVSSAYIIDNPPTTPGWFTGAIAGSSQINLSWTASTDDVTAQSAIVYEICQSNTVTGCSLFTATFITGALTYNVTNLSPLTTYYFTIRARDLAGNTSVPITLSATTENAVPVWGNQPAFTQSSIASVYQSNSEKIVVGSQGLIASTLDGVTWTTETSPTPNNLNSLTFNGVNHIAVGDSGAIILSTTMLVKGVGAVRSWILARPLFLTNLNGVATNGNVNVTVGDQGAIGYSRDGYNWVALPRITKSNLRSIAWVSGSFVVVGDTGTILTSPDGSTWSIAMQSCAGSFYGLASNGIQIVAVGLSGTICSSVDGGQSFSPVISPVKNGLRAVAWDGVRFVAVGDTGTIITSLDGNNWSIEKSLTTTNLRHVTGSIVNGMAHDIAVGDFGIVLTSP